MREISAGIIIYRKTPKGPKFLLTYHGNNYWNFPKGKIESGERSIETAFREIKEETGIARHELKIIEYFKANERFTFFRSVEGGKVKVFKVIIFYLAETSKRQIRLPDDDSREKHEGYGWFTYFEALRLLKKHKGSQQILAKARDRIYSLKRPAVK